MPIAEHTGREFPRHEGSQARHYLLIAVTGLWARAGDEPRRGAVVYIRQGPIQDDRDLLSEPSKE
jgi:hypothetical protein